MKVNIKLDNKRMLDMRAKYEASRTMVCRELELICGVKVTPELLRVWESQGNPKSCRVLMALCHLYKCRLEDMFTVEPAPYDEGEAPDLPF